MTWRYLSEVKVDATSGNPLLTDAVLSVNEKLAAQNYFDIAAAWKVTKQITLRAGINNLFDKDPPITAVSGPSIFGNGNTFPQVYDALGRRIFLTATAKF
jgi:iron complex outermembrane recepter protein